MIFRSEVQQLFYQIVTVGYCTQEILFGLNRFSESMHLIKGVSLSRTFKKGTFSQFSLKQKIKTLVKGFSRIFRYIFEPVKKKFSFENKTHIYLFFFFIQKGLLLIMNLKNCKKNFFYRSFELLSRKIKFFTVFFV